MWTISGLKDRVRVFIEKVVEADLARRATAAAAVVPPPTIDLSARDHAQRLEADLAAQMVRIDQLERLLTEHPLVATGDVDTPAFASPAVSIIMPTWNRARIIGAAIHSVLQQSFRDWELLVIDDGSEDDTSAVIAAFSSDPRIRYVRLPHAGQCPARNHGQSIARGALIAYLDSDNLWYPQFLMTAVNVFQHRPDVDCGYGAMVRDTNLPRILFEPFDRERLLKGNYIDTSTFIHRRDLIGRYGGFDQAASPMEDWDLILRYTIDKPALRLPVLAVRYRSVDAIRVSDTEDLAQPLKTIQDKWTKPL